MYRFSGLLELLDPQRFTRGVPVRGRQQLEAVMVRRLKEDLRQLGVEQFPKRTLVQLSVGDASSPELVLSQKLAEYTALARPQRGQGALVFINLQKRLLSSVEAFHRTLQAHHQAVLEGRAKVAVQLPLVTDDDEYGVDDDALDEADEARALAGGVTAYYELDIAGNVRHLRGSGGTDLGGYRYTAFGKTVENTASVEQPLRWKGRPYASVGGIELYDMRARWWSPELGSFLSIDEYAFHDARSTLWGWPNQNPVTFSDPSGRDGTTSNPIQDLLNSNLLPPGLTLFGKGMQMRNSGISMLANDATVDAGMQKMNCGNAMIAGAMGVLAADAQVIAGVADAAIGVANTLRGGGPYRAVRSANTGGEVHHMPAWGSLKKWDNNPFSYTQAPGIHMDRLDHMATASWGPQGAAWRAETSTMLQEGRFLEALQRDIADVQSKFPGKYDTQIEQMLDYLWGGQW